MVKHLSDIPVSGTSSWGAYISELQAHGLHNGPTGCTMAEEELVKHYLKLL